MCACGVCVPLKHLDGHLSILLFNKCYIVGNSMEPHSSSVLDSEYTQGQQDLAPEKSHLHITSTDHSTSSKGTHLNHQASSAIKTPKFGTALTKRNSHHVP